MRLVDSFSGNDANKNIEIRADDKGPGGASHVYRIEQREGGGAGELMDSRHIGYCSCDARLRVEQSFEISNSRIDVLYCQ